MCATSRKIELSVKPITILSQIYFESTRRGSDKVPIHGKGKLWLWYIVMGKALREDKASNTVYFEEIEWAASKIKAPIRGS